MKTLFGLMETFSTPAHQVRRSVIESGELLNRSRSLSKHDHTNASPGHMTYQKLLVHRTHEEEQGNNSIGIDKLGQFGGQAGAQSTPYVAVLTGVWSN